MQKHREFRSQGFGTASTPHITFTRGTKSTTLFVRPAILMAVAAVCTVLSLGYFGATAYWFMRDDMAASAQAERRQMETLYQDRIDRLKSEIERLSSRQMVERESVEQQVTTLLRRQQLLSKRHEVVTELMARAEESGIRIATQNPVPAEKPVRTEGTLANIDDDTSAMGGEPQPVKDPVKTLGLRGEPDTETGKLNLKPGIDPEEQAALEAVGNNLAVMDRESDAVLDALAVATEKQIDKIVAATKPLGVTLIKRKSGQSHNAVGGPFVPITGGTFLDRVTRTERVLKALHNVKNRARLLPLHRPTRSASISSQFGPRTDPFLKRLAMHTGMDFKAPYGARVFAAASGTVEHAGWSGGYGRMVEIRHANGFVTRYGHLSKVRVSEGDHIVAGDLIGNVGSTGRSTGPHLHYEVRQSDEAIDPAPFVTAGDRLAALLKH